MGVYPYTGLVRVLVVGRSLVGVLHMDMVAYQVVGRSLVGVLHMDMVAYQGFVHYFPVVGYLDFETFSAPFHGL
jgi:hypothetical protein